MTLILKPLPIHIFIEKNSCENKHRNKRETGDTSHYRRYREPKKKIIFM